MPVKKSPKIKKEKKPVLPVAEQPVLPMDSDDVEVVIPESELETKNGKEKYFPAVGRRKEAIARVRLFTKKSTDAAEDDKALVIVNGKDYTDYFTDVNLQHILESPLRKLKSLNRFKATVIVRGGGISGQANAVKHGLARALIQFDANFRRKLKKSGLLTRDPRVKERRKYGLKKARKAPQWSKR